MTITRTDQLGQYSAAVPAPRRSPLALAVLSMATEAPTHAYRMQQLIRERHKDDVINVGQRGSIYQAIARLERDGLLEVASVERPDRRPERTLYRSTALGRTTLRRWLRDMLAAPAAGFPEFPAALSFVVDLPREDAVAALEERLLSLQDAVDDLADERERAGTFLAPVFLLETDHQVRMARAEAASVEALLAALRTGAVDWPHPDHRPAEGPPPQGA
jgi:DNA-binding PadR family transcriptional regulator